MHAQHRPFLSYFSPPFYSWIFLYWLVLSRLRYLVTLPSFSFFFLSVSFLPSHPFSPGRVLIFSTLLPLPRSSGFLLLSFFSLLLAVPMRRHMMSQKKIFLVLIVICTASLLLRHGSNFSWWVTEIVRPYLYTFCCLSEKPYAADDFDDSQKGAALVDFLTS